MTEPKNLRYAILDGYFNGTDYEHVKDFAEYILSVLDGSLESSTIMKNCPFCGLKMDETPDYASDETKEVDVPCYNCCVTFNFGSRKRAEAIAAWNRRQNPELAALKADLAGKRIDQAEHDRTGIEPEHDDALHVCHGKRN
jgi:hypothetical protein